MNILFIVLSHILEGIGTYNLYKNAAWVFALPSFLNMFTNVWKKIQWRSLEFVKGDRKGSGGIPPPSGVQFQINSCQWLNTVPCTFTIAPYVFWAFEMNLLDLHQDLCANYHMTLLAQQPPAGASWSPQAPMWMARWICQGGPPYPPFWGPKLPTNQEKVLGKT